MAEISDQDTGLAKIVLGDYQWSVPIETLTTNSSFFRAALEGGFQESTTRVVEIHDQDPFIVGRAIEFLLYGKCEEIDPLNPPRANEESTFTQTMQQNRALPNFITNYHHHQCAPRCEIDCQVILFADFYGIDSLLSGTACHLFEGLLKTGKHYSESQYWKCHGILTTELIGRYAVLRTCFINALLANQQYFCYGDPRMLEWFQADSSFAAELIATSKLIVKQRCSASEAGASFVLETARGLGDELGTDTVKVMKYMQRVSVIHSFMQK